MKEALIVKLPDSIEISTGFAADLICTFYETPALDWWRPVAKADTTESPGGWPVYRSVTIGPRYPEDKKHMPASSQITYASIARGLSLGLTGDRIGTGAKALWLQAVVDGDAGMLDAGDADSIVQLAINGEIIFG